ncbi:IucA/IucC family siderophore biosynthesis protein [Halomicrobium mukohataei]|uniref:IucA/IucC family siderophore biosynthesis protein n=1 Tax=Halomicrobium mukohataei TaxID=57705 RepID=A0A847U9L3_9EURY|nr:IucA/IucC family siderophore biosynthesis protein [Halomicrobium mukohataei]NLV08927.1 IucA/IucC family siderophore biosynthesis protein [Halomicrobium mukohataei]
MRDEASRGVSSTAVERLRTTLQTDRWQSADRALLAKMLAEFTYEQLLDPQEYAVDGDWRVYRVPLGDTTYEFRAQERVFDSYRVDPSSIRKRVGDGAWTAASDAIQFLLDARETLGIDDQTASYLVREYNNTLLADTHIDADDDAADSILDLDAREIEGEMRGHPWFTVNKGRIGFDYEDYLRYAPENQRPQSLQWVAVRRSEATFASVDGLDYDGLMETHLGDHVGEFERLVSEQGLEPSEYYLMPVHEWQWRDTLAQLFAPAIAADEIVPLGAGPDTYLPQQSIRTLTNRSDPTKPHVKLPMRILNTIVYRGLPGEQALAAPRVTAAVKAIRDRDPFLSDECDLVLPGEIASINYEHPQFSQLSGAPYQYQELLGAVWRESVQSLTAASEQAVPLSALFHRDVDGSPIVSEFASRAGLSLSAWIDEFLDVLFEPLLHYLYKYGLVFMPHGTNVLVIHRDGRPVRIAVKDYVDEIALSEERLPEASVIPDDLYDHPDILHQKGPEALCQHIFGTVFICVLRYVSDLLEREAGYEETTFWRQVRDSIERYQSAHPELEGRFERFDLFEPEFTRLCLNRGRLTDYGYTDDPEPPGVTAHGTVTNTLAELGDDRHD